jgi:septal ring factor EnvC (AmiA/AmiB activator)
MACYEDLRALYAATAKERDELRKENEQLKEICEKQAEMNGRIAAMALELDEAKAEIERLNKENFWLTNGGRDG